MRSVRARFVSETAAAVLAGTAACSATATATKTKELPSTSVATATRFAPRHNLILLDDDDHTYDYVIEMLGVVFGFPIEKAFLVAEEVDASGRAIVFTGHLEVVELKQQQIHSYGADWRIPHCKGSMSATIEAVPE